MKPAWKVKVKVTQLCQTLCNPTDYTVHGILQATILEWVTFPFSRESFQPRDQTQVSCIAGRFFTSWGTRKALFTFTFTIQHQFSSVQFIRSVVSDSLHATPWIIARQASLSITNSEFAQTHVHWVGDAIQPSHPPSSPFPPAPNPSQHQSLLQSSIGTHK